MAVADGVIWCWVAGAGFGDGVAVLCGARLRVLGSAMEWLCFVVLGSAMEIGETEMRVR